MSWLLLPDGQSATTACGRSLHAPSSLHSQPFDCSSYVTDRLDVKATCFAVCRQWANKGFTSLVTTLKCTGCNQQFNSMPPACTASVAVWQCATATLTLPRESPVSTLCKTLNEVFQHPPDLCLISGKPHILFSAPIFIPTRQ